jgi:hypothetical protein
MKKAILFTILIFSTGSLVQAQTAAQLAGQQLLQSQEAEVTKLTTSTEQLRQLYSEGLIARVELEKAESQLVTAKAGVEETRAQIAAAEKLSAAQKKAAELAKVKSFVKPTSMSLRTPSVMRSTSGSWTLANLSMVQQFFSSKFGRSLPTSTIGQSATHNRMGWDHRHAVDVGLHPDSVEGRALISFLQSSGIPFLAFRGAIPGVSTGPHIHIGQPSHKIS